MDDIVIVSAARTPVGSFNGALSTLSAQALGAIALRAAFARAGVQAEDVDEVIFGQVLSAAGGQNPTRQAARAAGFPNVYNVADGFEGPPDASGHRGGTAGWKADRLPWRQRQ